MNIRKGTLLALAGVAVLLAACGGGLSTEDAIGTGIAQTVQISQLETAAAGGGAQATAVPQSGDGGSTGGEATSTLVPTTGPVFVTVTQDTNCRSGPSVAYRLIATILIGQQVEVLKSFPSSEYVVVKNPSGSGDCWLWLRYASVTDFTAFNLPTATQPPTPTATPTPLPSFAGSWTNKTSNGGIAYTDSITFAISGNTISGTTNWTGIPYDFTGTLSDDGQSASGNWTSTSSSGAWQAFLLNDNQFNGTIGGSWSFCGWRGGAGEPGVCLAP